MGRDVSTPKATKPAAPAKITEKQLRRIWSELKPQVLVERLRSQQPSARWTASGSRLSACCPYHEERTPSFHVYLDRGYAKCYGCEKFLTNPVELWAKVRGTGVSEALADLRQQFGLKFLSSAANAQLKNWERNQQLKKKIMAICHDELINAISHPNDPAYASAQPSVKYLLNTRQVPVDALPALPMLGIVPPLARLTQILANEAAEENTRREVDARLNGERVERFTPMDAEAKAYMQEAAGWVGSLIFRLDLAPDVIGRLKLRRPDTKDFLILKDPYEEELGFFGLSWPLYGTLLGSVQQYVPGLYIVEGEFDALSTMARQVQAGGPNFVVVSAGGRGTSNNLDSLRGSGFEEAYLVGDAPDKRGDELIADWLACLKELRSKIFIGHTTFPGCGDPDEAVVSHGLSAYQAVLLDIRNKAYFQTPQEWVYDKASPEIEATDESDIRYRMEIASEWGRLLKNNVECDAYVEFCHKAYGLPTALLKREIVAREEDEPAFILRVASALQQIFYVIGQRSLDNDRRLFLWYKDRRQVVQVSLADDGSCERELGAVLGTNYQLFQERIGVPAFLEPTESQKAKGAYLQELDKKYRWYLRQALIIMANGAPDFDMARHMGQGVHVVRDPQGGSPTIYVVNGKDVYYGTFDAADKLLWKKLDGPSYNGIIFDVGIRHEEPAWLEWIHSVEDLERASSIDLNHAWQRLYNVVESGWRYKNHAISSQFLATHLLASNLCNAFRRQVMVAFHADTRAGKSKMVMGLIGGTQFPRIKLIAGAVGMPDFTAAGIRQRMQNKVRPLCLDEFEDEGTGDKKSRTITETLEMFRNLVGEDNTYTMGSRSGEPVTWRMNFFVFFAAINKARKVQDANRMLTVYMERVDNRPDPVQILMREFGSNYMEQLKRDLSIVLLPHAARIHRVYEEIEKEYGEANAKPSSVDSRIFEALYPTLTLMKMMGMDYHKFVEDFCEANKEILTVSAGHTDSMALFDWLVQSPQLKMRVGDHQDRNDASVLQMLAAPETRGEINLSGSGIYYDDVTETLVVNWTMAVQTVLTKHARYSRETNTYNLRDLANRAPHAMKPSELLDSGVLNRLRGHGLMGVPLSHLTGYRVSHIIQGFYEAPVAPAATPAPAPNIIEPLPIPRAMDDADFT